MSLFAQTPIESQPGGTMLKEIANALAESLVQSEGVLELSRLLDQKGVPNELRSGLEAPQLAPMLHDLIRDNSLLSQEDLAQANLVNPSELGPWALEQLQASLSNQDSS